MSIEPAVQTGSLLEHFRSGAVFDELKTIVCRVAMPMF